MRKRLPVSDKSESADDPTIGAIRAEIARRRRTQTAAAAALDLSSAAFTRRMSGDVEFTVGELRRLAAWLGVPAASLLGEDALEAVSA